MGPDHDNNNSKFALDMDYNSCQCKYVVVACKFARKKLSITTICCDLAIATHGDILCKYIMILVVN